MSFRYFVIAVLFASLLASCKKDKNDDPIPTPTAPRLVFKFQFDSTQERLNNIGQPSTVPSGHAAQSPVFNSMSAHYIELAPNAFTQLGSGEVVYKAAQVGSGPDLAINFDSAVIAQEGETFFSIPLSSLTAGSYEWLRVSLAYQNYNIKYKSSAIPGNQIGVGTIASFIGFNTYIKNYLIKTQTQTINANRAQGYWGFETTVSGFNYVTDGHAPANATTVPNPISSTSPIPAGSCVVTAAFNQPLVITGNETQDVVVTISLSTNNSFEWVDNGDDLFQPEAGDAVVDMGVRGMMPIVQ